MKPYYAITKKIYGLEQANEWDYATLAAIATFNQRTIQLYVKIP